MNNLYQNTLWDHTNCNKDFYKKVEMYPNRVDWPMMIIQLGAHTKAPVTEIARHLETSRDHVEGLKIGKINKPRFELVKPILELVCKHVPPERLKLV